MTVQYVPVVSGAAGRRWAPLSGQLWALRELENESACGPPKITENFSERTHVGQVIIRKKNKLDKIRVVEA